MKLIFTYEYQDIHRRIPRYTPLNYQLCTRENQNEAILALSNNTKEIKYTQKKNTKMRWALKMQKTIDRNISNVVIPISTYSFFNRFFSFLKTRPSIPETQYPLQRLDRKAAKS